MFKLMKLELKKFSLRIKSVIIANLIMLAVIVLVFFTSANTNEVSFSDYTNAFMFIGTIARSTFTIFAAVLISRLIIGEYKNKTINVMFLYPIQRRKIMIAKLLIILIFTFITMFLSALFLDFSLYSLNIFFNFIKAPLTFDILIKNLINLTVYSVTFSFISLIPVYFGMRNKSGTATIVSAIILVSVFNSGTNDISLSAFIIFPIIGALLGVISLYMAIKDIEEVDVIT